MTDIRHQAHILEAIDQLRRRKARPDVDRICNYLSRRFGVDTRETVSDLERLVHAETVIRVEYKGNTSYRNAAKWSRFAMYSKNKEDAVSTEGTSGLLSSAVAELIIQEPDYLDFGVPATELERCLMEKDSSIATKKQLDTILQRELSAGNLVCLENGNYSLADHPVPPNPIASSPKSTEVKVLKSESPVHVTGQPEQETFDVPNQLKPKMSAVGRPSTNAAKRSLLKTVNRETQESGSTTMSGSSVTIGGFRVGVRRKRAKKVFDPSDNNIPTRKRGRPIGSTNKNKESSSAGKTELQQLGPACYVCHGHTTLKKGSQAERMLSCRDCSNRVHPSCAEIDSTRMSSWQCVSCRPCCSCDEVSEAETVVVCVGCNDAYHPSCHIPRLPDVKSNRLTKWQCSSCSPPTPSKPSPPVAAVPQKKEANNTSFTGHCAPTEGKRCLPSPTADTDRCPPPAACGPLPPPCSWDVDDAVDERIPDASSWSTEQVEQYLIQQGYVEQAAAFREHDIDGASLLLMRRNDVLTGLDLLLGPALKVYGLVKRLQLRRSEMHLIWG